MSSCLARTGISFSTTVCVGCLLLSPVNAEDVSSSGETKTASAVESTVEQYCFDCHNESESVAGIDFEKVLQEPFANKTAVWEAVVKKLRGRQMPPGDADRPSEQEYQNTLHTLQTDLDALAEENPNPGRTAPFRRLNRTEYHNAIRDLLALDVDVNALLPADESSYGFDNVTVADLSPTLLSRYIAAAQKIARLAVGGPLSAPSEKTFRVAPDVTQEERVEGLPIGTRGGLLIPFTFPRDGEYEISVRLTRDRDEHVEGLNRAHELELLIDLERVALFTVEPPQDKLNREAASDWEKPSHENVDRHCKARVTVTAGPHKVAVTFVKEPSSLLESKRQPLNVHFNMYRHPRLTPAVYQVSIAGPFTDNGVGDTPSRKRIFVRYPQSEAEEDVCARTILSSIIRRAYRRPTNADDLNVPFNLYRNARDNVGFDGAIELALSSILVNPEFLFRIESDPTDVPPQTTYRVSDLELASRLSFFLWSSIPDDELLDLASRAQLSRPETLREQTLRMLRDKRAETLVTNFASQWLYLRNLDSITPDGRQFPDFDDNLRQAFRAETEMLFESIMREDRSVLDLIQADYTFLNERLAKHYGVPHVYGSRFRRVALDKDSRRGGLLRHGSVLTVTSYATRTSPVIRGKWILENVLGTPPPPPPGNVPALEDNTVNANLSVRERLAEHRSNVACAGCHALIDPPGFALENFDAVGRWRDSENGVPVDASGGLPDGSTFDGIDGLEQGLLDRPEMFVTTLTEKLLTFALGRGVEHFDGPAIRGIVRNAGQDEYRFSSIILGVVNSTPFQMRQTQ
ncbi:MAG: DUF1592 domain-containing protein [Planctomycetales bacterium]|nr:DUF1592 domain-containing protein [Planctomycetales bacterium]